MTIHGLFTNQHYDTLVPKEENKVMLYSKVNVNKPKGLEAKVTSNQQITEFVEEYATKTSDFMLKSIYDYLVSLESPVRIWPPRIVQSNMSTNEKHRAKKQFRKAVVKDKLFKIEKRNFLGVSYYVLHKNWNYKAIIQLRTQSKVQTKRVSSSQEPRSHCTKLLEHECVADWKIYPKKHQIYDIIADAHCDFGSHQKIERTKAKILDNGYRWRYMEKEISKFIKYCSICQIKRKKMRKNTVNKYLKTKRPRQKYQIDLVTLVADVRSKNVKYLFT